MYISDLKLLDKRVDHSDFHLKKKLDSVPAMIQVFLENMHACFYLPLMAKNDRDNCEFDSFNSRHS